LAVRIARRFAFRRWRVTGAATAIHVLQLGAGEFSHDLSPPKSQPYDEYKLAISLSAIAMQGFAQGANSISHCFGLDPKNDNCFLFIYS
jgi:hypothetical protein